MGAVQSEAPSQTPLSHPDASGLAQGATDGVGKVMGRSYVKKSFLDADVWVEYQPSRTAIDVICEDDRPQRTGLLDADGNELFRAPRKRPIGFTTVWDEE